MGKDAQKEKTKNMLKAWGKQPFNKTCADCSIKQPGWASTNIGVIVCIHCSGIHRKLGVHISFVKSLTLDSWQPKLAKKFIAQGGNRKINDIYEANLPKGVKPTDPTDMRRLEVFIRNKYEHKKWFSAKGKKKKKKSRQVSDSESEDEDSSDSDESSEPKSKKKVDNRDRTRKSKRKKRRPRPAPAKAAKPVKKETISKPVKVVAPADNVPDLLDFGSMKIQTTEPAKNDEFNLFSDFSPKNQTSPPSFIPGMSDQPPQTQPQAAAIDPFQPNPVQQVNPVANPQSATDKVMSLFSSPQQPQQNNQANIFTQMNGPNPGFGGGFQQQPGFQQRQMQGFPQQQQRPQMGGFGGPQMGFQQQRGAQMGFGRGGFQQQGFQQQQMGGFGARPNQMGFQQQQGFQQNQMNFGGFNQQQQPMSGFGAPQQQQQQQNAFSGFGNFQQSQNNSGGFGFM